VHCIPEGFLPQLGVAFLRRLYARIARSDTCFSYVSGSEADVTGFVAVAENTASLYREFVFRDGMLAALSAAPAIARHPVKVTETLRHGSHSNADRAGAEILAVAVAPAARGRGTGAALVSAAVDELRRRGVREAHVVTAADNDAAKHMYARCGFERHSVIEVHRGVPQEVFVWRG
jgi:ribosomal protein S18 acetylase RimI-like enzyme